MDSLKMHSKDFTEDNIEQIEKLFPNCITESEDENGNLKKSIDFDLLRQELSTHIIEGPQERYRLDWPGKRKALLAANIPIAKSLRPYRKESVDFDTTENLLIEGDNLDALKLLQETYLGKVKMIYIDPPYNTGFDSIYKDKFFDSVGDYLLDTGQVDLDSLRLVANHESTGRFHSNWLTMMYPRLKLARNIIKDDGIIFISIDEAEVANLKGICDEVFGQDNFIEQIAWKNKYGSGALTKGFANVHEYILVYSKSSFKNLSAPLNESQKSAYTLKDEKYKIRGGYITQPLATNSKDDRPNLQYSIFHNGIEIKPEKQWIWSEKRFLEAYENNEIVIKEKKGKYSVRSKQYLRDENGRERLGKPISFLNGPFNQEGTKEIALLFKTKVFGFPKPTSLIKYLLSFIVNNKDEKDCIILDFFGGSGSTAHAVMQLNAEDGGNRKFIMVQLAEECNEKSEAFKAGYKTIAEISKERIRRAGKKIKKELTAKLSEKKKSDEVDLFDGATETSEPSADDLDIGFRVLKIESSNMMDVYYLPDKIEQEKLALFTDNIKPDRSSEDLLFQVLLDWGVDLTLPVTREIISGREVFFVDGNALAACFEKTGEITEEFCKELARREPLRVVFRDSGFKDDSAKINVEQIFKLFSPHTEVKSI